MNITQAVEILEGLAQQNDQVVLAQLMDMEDDLLNYTRSQRIAYRVVMTQPVDMWDLA